MKNSYQEVNISQDNIKTTDESAKTFVSMVKLKSSDQSQNKIKKISYIDPLLSAIHSSQKNNSYKFKAIKTEDFFSF